MLFLSGKSWLHCVVVVLLLLVLCGSLGFIQKWLVTSESVHGHKLGSNHRWRRAVLCLEDEFLDVESDTCQKCPVCPYGYKLNKACGNGLGADATCSHCTSNYYQRDGECYPCKYCQGREILEKCTNTSNTKCSSQCLEGYFMSVTKQCIRIRYNQRPRPAPPQKTPEPTSSKLSNQSSTTVNKIDITTILPPSLVKAQNENNSELPFPNNATPSVNGKARNSSVPLATVAVLFFGCFLPVVIVACVLKGRTISSAVLKGKIFDFCCCRKNKQSEEKDGEMTVSENNSPETSDENLTSHPLLTNKDTQSFIEVIIDPEEIEDDVFPMEPVHEIQGEVTDYPEMLNSESDDQNEGEMQHRYAANVMFISGALPNTDLDKLKSYLCIAISNNFTEKDKEIADSFEKIATILHQRLLCSWSNTGILVKGLTSINRHDLAQKLEKLDKPEKCDQFRRLRRSSSRQD